jgi:hypothetical protein
LSTSNKLLGGFGSIDGGFVARECNEILRHKEIIIHYLLFIFFNPQRTSKVVMITPAWCRAAPTEGPTALRAEGQAGF